jgi:Tol biopolymer transport system component/DNA-binding winged helix-turn-helix (wHTH) protein
MPETLRPLSVIHFGPFAADLQSQELRKHGVRLRLPGQSFQILRMLLERNGELVTRDELRLALWPENTYVDFDHGVNAAVNRLRETLGDSADTPHLIETVPRRGYRFIGPLHNGTPVSSPKTGDAPKPSAEPPKGGSSRSTRQPLAWVYGLGFAIAIGALLTVAVVRQKRNATPPTSQRALTRLTFDDGLQIGATWSPDGRFIAYSSDRGGKFDIWVQQVSGGDPVQITKGPAHNWQPDWSPDGKFIAYRSEDGDGGLYVVPALGGAGLARRIASFGYYPRWSPDSSRILFQSTGFALGCEFFVVALDGNPPHAVQPDLTDQNWAMSAAWHPDGKRISIWVWEMKPSPMPIFWTAPVEGGAAVKTDISPKILKEAEDLAGNGVSSWADSDFKFSWARSGAAIYFERTFRGARNIWRIRVNPQTLKALAIERLTTGPELDADFSPSPDGSKMAFTSESRRVQAWMFPFDANHGRMTGSGKAVTSAGMEAWESNISRDGRRLAFLGKRSGRWELWEKSLVDGQEIPVVPNDSYVRNEPQWSPDGTRLAYVRIRTSTRNVQAAIWSRSHGEEPITTPSQLGMFVFDWSADGQWLLASRENEKSGQSEIWVLPASSEAKAKARRLIACDPNTNLWQSRFSPDGRWIVFEAEGHSQSAIYVTPAPGGAPWTRITEGKHWNDKPRWSPDGRIIYFVSERRGFFNVWGIHFDPVHGKAVGEPFPLTAFDNPRLMVADVMPTVGLSLTQDQLIVTLAQVSGSIWVLDNVEE